MSQPIETILGVWSDGPGPLHRKLSDAVRAAVDDGRLPAGERLPSERDLAARLALSRSTVVTAYDTLVPASAVARWATAPPRSSSAPSTAR